MTIIPSVVYNVCTTVAENYLNATLRYTLIKCIQERKCVT